MTPSYTVRETRVVLVATRKDIKKSMYIVFRGLYVDKHGDIW